MKYLPIKLVAELLELSEKTMLRLIDRQCLPSFKWGCVWVSWPAVQQTLHPLHPLRRASVEELRHRADLLLDKHLAPVETDALS